MRRFVPALVFLCSLFWFAAFQPWGGFADPDAFYHAKTSALMAAQGPLQAFPWLDLTVLNTFYADLHFLFHVVTIPFQWVFGMLWGMQVAAVVFAALFALLFFLVAKRYGAAPGLATALALSSSGLIVRLSLAKASPLAIGWLVFGLWATTARRHWLVAVATFGFALTHGGWIMLVGSVFLFCLGEVLYDTMVLNKGLKHWREWNWRSVLGATAGAAIGTLVHPNFPTNLHFLWVQVFKIGVLTPGRVILGQEWSPVGLGELLTGIAPLLLAGLFTLYIVLFVRRQQAPSTEVGRRIIGTGLVVAAFFALTIKSRRSIEYLVPVLALWLSALWTLVDPVALRADVSAWWLKRRTLVIFLVVLLAFMVGKDWIETRQSLVSHARPFGQFAPAMRAISERAKPGERVFHADWDEFPQLFVLDDRLHYISGVDPTFLLEANPTLSDAYRDLTLGTATSSPYTMIHDVFHSSFVFLERPDHAEFERLVEADARFKNIYRDEESAAYQVE
jgi:hypothetical protein